MAYDWSGNNLKQQRYDRVIMVALLALALVMTVTPIALLLGNPQTHLTQTTSVDMKSKRLRM